MSSPIVQWIQDNVKGLSFADIGGIGVGSTNERVSSAVEAGALEATMIDFRRDGFPEWTIFDEKMAQKKITSYHKIFGANLEDRTFPEQVGKFDFVHCTGIIYHAPAPMLMLYNLSQISTKFLIVNTVTLPDSVKTPIGTLEFPGSQILFLPGLSEQERSILDMYYQELLGWPEGRFKTFAPEINDADAAMPWLQTRAASTQHFWAGKGDMSYTPYWMLFTGPAFRAAVKLFGFNIKAEHSYKNHTLTLFCERT